MASHYQFTLGSTLTKETPGFRVAMGILERATALDPNRDPDYPPILTVWEPQPGRWTAALTQDTLGHPCAESDTPEKALTKISVEHVGGSQSLAELCSRAAPHIGAFDKFIALCEREEGMGRFKVRSACNNVARRHLILFGFDKWYMDVGWYVSGPEPEQTERWPVDARVCWAPEGWFHAVFNLPPTHTTDFTLLKVLIHRVAHFAQDAETTLAPLNPATP